MMDELEQLEIYSNEIAPLEEMVSKLEAENNQLRVELARIKPSWDLLHPFIKWIAQDKNYSWGVFKEKPHPHDVYWQFADNDQYFDMPMINQNWHETLERRPESE